MPKWKQVKIDRWTQVNFHQPMPYETGKQNITLLSLAELAKALNVEPKELLEFNNQSGT